MGPENGKAEDLILYTEDGVEIAPVRDLPEVTVEEVAQAFWRVMEEMSVSISVKQPKYYRCRSRKRFIKLMMSEGISRNYAERLAYFVRMLMPYGKAWRHHLRTKWIRGVI